MSIALTVKIDTKQFEERLGFAAKEAVNAMRRVVDKTARAARRDAIKTMVKDIGVPASKFRDATPLVKGSTQGNISASWTIKKKAIGIMNVGVFAPGMSANRGSFSGSTFRESGGGSSSLNIQKAFILTANGGQALMIRTGKGKKAIHAVYAEMPNTGMATPGDAPRKTWEQVADATLAPTMAAEIQKALDGIAGQNPSSVGGE